MKRCFGLYLLAAMSLACPPAMADAPAPPPDAGISDQIKSDLNVGSNADEVAEINQKVQQELTKLAQNPQDAATVASARDWLISQMMLQDNPGNTSPAYQTSYADVLNRQFLAVLSQPATAVNTRLNIGIIIAQLQGKTGNLAGTVVQLLNDSSPAVVLWGEKAAGAMLPVASQNPAFVGASLKKVVDAVVDAVAAHPSGKIAGFIAEEGYRAINPEMVGWPVGLFPPANVLDVLVDANLKLQKTRLDFYTKGVTPESPKSDTYASYLLLATSSVWNGMSADQRSAAVQQAADLICWAGQRAANAPNNQNDELINALNEEGQWIVELAKILQDQNLQSAGTNVYVLTVTSPAKSILDACNAVYPALQQEFPNLKDPSQLENAKSASDNPGPAPASEAQR